MFGYIILILIRLNRASARILVASWKYNEFVIEQSIEPLICAHSFLSEILYISFVFV